MWELLMVHLYLENKIAGFPVYLQCSHMIWVGDTSEKMKWLQLVEIIKDIIAGKNAAFLNEVTAEKHSGLL